MAYKQQQPGDHRRKWDEEEYEQKAKRRAEEEQNIKEKKESEKKTLLKARDFKVDLNSKLGKSIIITPSSQGGGYFCNVCDCGIRDSISFLDHINGKKHQKNLGMSMRVERSTLEQVKRRFKENKKKLEEKKDYDFEQRLQELKGEEERHREYRREKRKERKRKRTYAEMNEEVDPDMISMMGFSGFSSSKK